MVLCSFARRYDDKSIVCVCVGDRIRLILSSFSAHRSRQLTQCARTNPIQKTKIYRNKSQNLFRRFGDNHQVLFFFVGLPIFAENPLAADNSGFIIRNDGGNSVYQWSLIELGLVAVCVRRCRFFGADIALPHWLDHISIWNWRCEQIEWATALNQRDHKWSRIPCVIWQWQTHRTGKRNQLILMIMQRQKILE